jgi:hypothetical protein
MVVELLVRDRTRLKGPAPRARTPFSARARAGLNRLLNGVGLELSTTRARRAEDRRLAELQHRRHWGVPRYDGGITFRDEGYLRFLANVCAPFKQEIATLGRQDGASGAPFPLDNDYFGGVDAGVLYAIVRGGRACHIVECGSGFSTRLMRRAVEDGGLSTAITAIDPEPRTEIGSQAGTHIRLPVERVDVPAIVGRLAANDILFVDSSHAVRTGGDVPYLCLEVLPRLASGVLVHLHDIFLPFDYPEEWVVRRRWGWTEQYIVHAFLCYNEAFQILWPGRYMWEYHREAVLASVPMRLGRPPSSLWLVRL